MCVKEVERFVMHFIIQQNNRDTFMINSTEALEVIHWL